MWQDGNTVGINCPHVWFNGLNMVGFSHEGCSTIILGFLDLCLKHDQTMFVK
jgi:hypothetical protein